MVAAASPFGISKAALERRINNQIPRKRHTPYTTTKSLNRVAAKHTARPKPKQLPARSRQKTGFSSVPENKPEKRGTNRMCIAGSSEHGINQWPARRILASRQHPFKPSRTQYKVQWENTWEDSSDITGLAVTEWKEAVESDKTFDFRAHDGSKWTVLEDATCLENDSEESQWEMWTAIRRNVVKELDKDWFVELKDGDFVFTSEREEMEVRQDLNNRWPEEKISANNILRAAWTRMSNKPELLETDIPFWNIKVRFVAQLDPWMDAEHDKSGIDPGQRVEYTVATIIMALLPNPLEGLEDDAFSKGNAQKNYSRWCKVIKLLIQKAPFTFKSGTWLQLLAFLVLGSESFRRELEAVGIKVQDDWCQRGREYDMHMYYDQIVDNRSTHDIQETFLNLRDFFRDLVPDEKIVPESRIDEIKRSSSNMIDEGSADDSIIRT